MNLLGYEVGGLRMPLTELTEGNTEKLAKAMKEFINVAKEVIK